MCTLPTPTRSTQLQQYTPHYPSPLSSSPLRNSPSPLANRDTNVPSRGMFEYEDCVMSSPTKLRRRANAISHIPITSAQTPVKQELMSPPLSSPPTVSYTSSTRRKPCNAPKEAFNKRPIRSNPLIHGRGEGNGRETRRKLFLKKIKDDRDEERWQQRMENGGEEEILRVLWVEEEKARLEKRRREAEMVGLDLDGIDEEVEEESYDEMMAAEVARQEDLELEGLIANYSQGQVSDMKPRDRNMDAMCQNPRTPVQHTQQHMETPYGSDEEEYDHIFMDVIEEENRMASQQNLLQQQSQPPVCLDEDHEMMDMY